MECWAIRSVQKVENDHTVIFGLIKNPQIHHMESILTHILLFVCLCCCKNCFWIELFVKKLFSVIIVRQKTVFGENLSFFYQNKKDTDRKYTQSC